MLRNGRLKICRECTKKDALRRQAMGPCQQREECKGCIQKSQSSGPPSTRQLELQIWCPKCFHLDGKGLVHVPLPARFAPATVMEGTCPICHHVFCLSAATVRRLAGLAKNWRGEILKVYPTILLHVTGEGRACRGCDDDKKASEGVTQQKLAREYVCVDDA